MHNLRYPFSRKCLQQKALHSVVSNVPSTAIYDGRFMTGRRLGIEHNTTSLLWRASMSIQLAHSHVILLTVLSTYSWHLLSVVVTTLCLRLSCLDFQCL
ncbi:uncharacterized protein BDV17DRAFT_215387 [Aspergillus undulatus]|uniref:uncharacterized protein n=1 Tax=Aspergillus undulatus TaxID=1810928 RepID=UPI003CCCD705